MRQFLRLNSVLLLLVFASCANPYKSLEKIPLSGKSAFIYKPVFQKEIYRCTVNGRFLFKKFHLSGVLLIKELQNGTVRAIFQNEMGFTFFDFEWDNKDSFKVKSIIPQLNKPAVIKTLKKDFNLLLMKGLNEKSEILYSADRGKTFYYCFSIVDGFAYYIEQADTLKQIENAGQHKKVITITLMGKQKASALPDSVLFNHHKANFTISLHKINDHVDE